MSQPRWNHCSTGFIFVGETKPFNYTYWSSRVRPNPRCLLELDVKNDIWKGWSNTEIQIFPPKINPLATKNDKATPAAAPPLGLLYLSQWANWFSASLEPHSTSHRPIHPASIYKYQIWFDTSTHLRVLTHFGCSTAFHLGGPGSSKDAARVPTVSPCAKFLSFKVEPVLLTTWSATNPQKEISFAELQNFQKEVSL